MITEEQLKKLEELYGDRLDLDAVDVKYLLTEIRRLREVEVRGSSSDLTKYKTILRKCDEMLNRVEWRNTYNMYIRKCLICHEKYNWRINSGDHQGDCEMKKLRKEIKECIGGSDLTSHPNHPYNMPIRPVPKESGLPDGIVKKMKMNIANRQKNTEEEEE